MKNRLPLAALVLGVVATQMVNAQEFPSRAVTIIVSAPAGGTTDILARLVAVPMTRALGQAVIVENIGGASGRIGTAKAAHAKPDGYTLNLGNMGFLAASVPLYPKLGFDPRTDFDPVGVVAFVPTMLVASNASNYHNLRSLMDAMRTKPGLVTIATPGPGSTSDLTAALFLSRVGAKANVINYKGGGPALSDVMGGQVDMMFDQTSGLIPAHRSGRVRGLAVSSAQRLPQIPDVPTFAEAGLTDFGVKVWNALVAPAGTPKPVMAKLGQALNAALDDPIVKKAVDQFAGEIPSQEERGPAYLQRLLTSEVDRWTKVVRETGMKAE
jgi:tripartite-type tricarboxylate transporter receptor subunit TctC